MAAPARFQDLFSAHAACYARARPAYPAELFEYLARLAPGRRLAWDAGTGNGQAAIGLAGHFERVIATDASEGQIAHATPHQRIEYRVALAENADVPAGRVDLVAVAQALHWFPLDAFYANVRRVAAPGGVIAAWCYGVHRVEPRIDAVCERLYRDIAGPYWPAARRYIDEQYETIPFPFEAIEPRPSGRAVCQTPNPDDACPTAAPCFVCRETWTLGRYLDYLESWSAVQRFKEARGLDPLDEIAADLSAAWGNPDQRRAVTWPIHLRVGRVGATA